MQNQELSVVVLDSDSKAAEQGAALVRFLGYPAYTATNEQSFRARIDELPSVVAVFVAADPGYKLLDCVLRVATEKSLKCGCCLTAGKGVSEKLPAAYKSRIQAVVPEKVSYRELLKMLQEAVLFFKSGGSTGSESSALLYRNLVGGSRATHNVHQLIRQVANTEASVLVTGESGTGKEVVARCIHSLSSRRDHPFVPINCGAIPAELLESELFGHEKGAFTGAITSRQGRFEIAEGGTLFLDEIGDMPLDMQVKLLRVLQELTFERVGSHKSIRSNVRIVAATHRDLEQLVAEGKFRLDLFYRLNVFPIEITPISKRLGDIPLLVEFYINKLELEQRNSLRLSECALACLARYSWPGNVRELFNLLERLAILFPDKIIMWSDLPDKFRPNQELFVEPLDDSTDGLVPPKAEGRGTELPLDGLDLRPHLADIERSLMTQALMQSEWVVARAAKLLNLQRTTLVEKMRKFEIQRPQEVTNY